RRNVHLPSDHPTRRSPDHPILSRLPKSMSAVHAVRFSTQAEQTMHRQQSLCAVFFLLAALSLAPAQQKARAGHVPAPSEFLGFEVGADRKLADYRQIVTYLKALAASSDRVEIQNLGKTTLGEEMVMAVISDPENLRNKEKHKEIAHKLADPRGLSPA